MKTYRKKGAQPMRPYEEGEVLSENVSISDEDKKNGSPKVGDMIAMNINNENDQWLVAEKFFRDNYESVEKTLDNKNTEDTKSKTSDVVVLGNPDQFKLICKASSKSEGWMKSTKACQVGSGCIVQVTTQQRNPNGSYSLAEALTFAPNTRIHQSEDGVYKLM